MKIVCHYQVGDPEREYSNAHVTAEFNTEPGEDYADGASKVLAALRESVMAVIPAQKTGQQADQRGRFAAAPQTHASGPSAAPASPPSGSQRVADGSLSGRWYAALRDLRSLAQVNLTDKDLLRSFSYFESKKDGEIYAAPARAAEAFGEWVAECERKGRPGAAITVEKAEKAVKVLQAGDPCQIATVQWTGGRPPDGHFEIGPAVILHPFSAPEAAHSGQEHPNPDTPAASESVIPDDCPF